MQILPLMVDAVIPRPDCLWYRWDGRIQQRTRWFTIQAPSGSGITRIRGKDHIRSAALCTTPMPDWKTVQVSVTPELIYDGDQGGLILWCPPTEIANSAAAGSDLRSAGRTGWVTVALRAQGGRQVVASTFARPGGAVDEAWADVMGSLSPEQKYVMDLTVRVMVRRVEHHLEVWYKIADQDGPWICGRHICDFFVDVSARTMIIGTYTSRKLQLGHSRDDIRTLFEGFSIDSSYQASRAGPIRNPDPPAVYPAGRQDSLAWDDYSHWIIQPD